MFPEFMTKVGSAFYLSEISIAVQMYIRKYKCSHAAHFHSRSALLLLFGELGSKLGRTQARAPGFKRRPAA